MDQIWKYTLEPEINIEMPKGAIILHVAAQGSEACLWARVDPSAKKETRSFAVFGTGHDLPDCVQLVYTGTARMNNGLVFHVFEDFSR